MATGVTQLSGEAYLETLSDERRANAITAKAYVEASNIYEQNAVTAGGTTRHRPQDKRVLLAAEGPMEAAFAVLAGCKPVYTGRGTLDWSKTLGDNDAARIKFHEIRIQAIRDGIFAYGSQDNRDRLLSQLEGEGIAANREARYGRH